MILRDLKEDGMWMALNVLLCTYMDVKFPKVIIDRVLLSAGTSAWARDLAACPLSVSNCFGDSFGVIHSGSDASANAFDCFYASKIPPFTPCPLLLGRTGQ